jgi:hypothetical protein
VVRGNPVCAGLCGPSLSGGDGRTTRLDARAGSWRRAPTAVDEVHRWLPTRGVSSGIPPGLPASCKRRQVFSRFRRGAASPYDGWVSSGRVQSVWRWRIRRQAAPSHTKHAISGFHWHVLFTFRRLSISASWGSAGAVYLLSSPRLMRRATSLRCATGCGKY